MNNAYERPAFNLGLGFALVFAVPIVSAVACLFVLPIPLSFAAMTVLTMGWFVGHIVTAGALGRLALEKAGKGDTSPFAMLATGLAILSIVWLIPVLSVLVYVAVCMLGLGATFQTARELRAEAWCPSGRKTSRVGPTLFP
ncbi:MAG: hypothetical protein GY898_33340 [Proteobacteria bacterium]|nr:hypothetical protein [Pseudomonadota bacterium]